MRAVGAYIFAGGFTLGVREHFDVERVLEDTDYGVAVMRRNQPDIPVHLDKSKWPLEMLEASGQIDFIYGNPPCAAWSVAGASMTGQPKDWRLDPRVDCTRVHFGLLERLRPRAWAWESVTPAFTKGRELVDALTLRALAMGYSVSYVLHDAATLGLPQWRKRFFFVATDCSFDVDPPEQLPLVTCGDFLRRINDVGEPLEHHLSKYRGWLDQVIPGEDLRQTWERLNPVETRTFRPNGFTVGRPPFTMKRPRPDRPANTVMHEMMHPVEHRGMSIRELAALCGFPPDYEFPEGQGDHSLVARGVCPPVGAWLAKNVARCLDRNEREAPTVRLIDVVKPPGSTRVLPWPADPATPVEAAEAPVVELADAPAPRPPREPRQATARPVATAGRVNIRPNAGTGSGAYIRVLLMTGRFSQTQILEAVHEHYPTSKAGPSDVSWNKQKLRKEGYAVPETPR